MENAFEAIVKLLKLEFVLNLNLNFAVSYSASDWSCMKICFEFEFRGLLLGI